MIAILAAVIRFIGWQGCVAIAVLVFYEGIPGINRLPYVDRFPIIRELGVGRVELARREAVAGLVKQSELDALAAVLAQERAKTAASSALATEARNRAVALLRTKEAQSAEIERLMELAREANGLTYPSKEDLEWSARQR